MLIDMRSPDFLLMSSGHVEGLRLFGWHTAKKLFVFVSKETIIECVTF